jgi:hypothetical protein
MRLGVRTSGAEYAANTVPVDQVLKQSSDSPSADSTPAVVWIYDPSDEKDNASAQSNLFQNEGVGIALKKFRTLRVDVTAIRSERVKELYKSTPAFRFYDPSGELVGILEGRNSDSLSSFSSLLERTWDKSFTVRLRGYTKQMTKILDRLDRFDGQKQVLDQNLARLSGKPNARKQRQLEKESEELEKVAREIAEDEQELLASVKLRDDFLPKSEDGEKVARK